MNGAFDHIAENGQVWPKIEMLEDHPDPRPQLGQPPITHSLHDAISARLEPDTGTLEINFASIGWRQKIDATQQRGFPRATRAQHTNSGTALDLEADIVEYAVRPKLFTRLRTSSAGIKFVSLLGIAPHCRHLLEAPHPGFNNRAEQPIKQDCHGERFEYDEVGRLDVVCHIG